MTKIIVCCVGAGLQPKTYYFGHVYLKALKWGNCCFEKCSQLARFFLPLAFITYLPTFEAHAQFLCVLAKFVRIAGQFCPSVCRSNV